MSSSFLSYALAAAALVLVLNGDARAQICGDADNSGAVTVTDGVQALRAAAGLDSACTNATCDIDGSGGVTVTDGVNVLRKAAGIAITENCGGGGLNAQVAELLRNTVPIFGGLTKIGAGAQAALAAGTAGCDNDPEGTISFDSEFNEIVFDTCQIEGIEYDGTIGIDDTGTTLSFDVDFTDLTTDEFFSFFGDLSFRTSGSNDVIAGSLEISFSNLGDLVVAFEDVQSDPNGNFVGGSLFFDAADSDIEGVSGIRIGLTASSVAPVSVFLTDQTQLDFNFDLVTGELTPVSS